MKSKVFFGYRSFEPEYAAMKEMRKHGIDTVTIMVSNNTNFMGAPYTRYQPTWIWEREYDFTLFDRNILDVTEAVPDVKLNVVLDLNPPSWWMPRLAGRDVYNEFGRVAPLKEYRDDVCDYLKALLKHAVARYPGRFGYFFVMGGLTTEWFDTSRGTESMARIEAWDRWRKKRGLEPCDIPGYHARYSGVPESGGLLRTPATHQLALDYLKFNCETSRETVGLFCRTARACLPPEIGVGTTYGYMFELPWSFSKGSWGHLDYEKLYDMPEVDMGWSPFSYGAEQRGMGGSPIPMIPMQTLRVRGKMMLGENDTTTFTSRFPKAPGKSGEVAIMGRKIEWKTPEEVRAGLRREICWALVNGISIWNFDMWGGWYDNDAALNTIAECKKIWDAETVFPAADFHEVVIAVDPENCRYINDSHELCDQFVSPVRRALASAGGMYTTASFNDLEKMDLSKTRLIILCHPFDLDNGKLEKIRKLAEGRTILWLYGPGIIHNGKWDPEHMRKLAGAPFGGKEIVYNGNFVYMPNPGEAAEPDLRKIEKYARVHCWCETPLPVYANGRLAAIHIDKARKVTLNLPKKSRRVTELFSGQQYFETDHIEIETKGPDTLLFRYE